MSNLNKFYLSAVLIYAGIGIFFVGKHYSNFFANDPKITDTAALLDQETSDSTIKTETMSGLRALASVPEEFSLEKHVNRKTEAQGKLMISSDATIAPFPQNEGDPYTWSPIDGYIIEGTVDSIALNKDSKSFGVSLKNDLGRFIYRENPARLGAVAFFYNCEGVHRFSHSSSGSSEWTIEEVPYHDVICTSTGSTYPIHASNGGYPRRSLQINHSDKTIARSIQLNASGHYERRQARPPSFIAILRAKL